MQTTLPFPPLRSTCTALLLVSLFLWNGGSLPVRAASGPWDLTELRKTPAAEWGAKTNLIQEVLYEGEPYQGKPTRVFAYVGRPASGKGPFPAILLVH